MTTRLTAWGYVRQYLLGDPVHRAKDKLERATRQLAERQADVSYNASMANFYTEQLLDISPDTDWWDWADAKQKQQDFQQEALLGERKAAPLTAQVQARREHYNKLRGRT